MPTFKAVVSAHQRRADGSYNIKIRVTHKRVSRWLPTNLNAYPSDLTRNLKIKNKSLEYRCNDLIREMRDAVSDLSSFALEDKDVDWVVGRIKAKMSGKAFSLDFFAFAYDYLQVSKSPATRSTYLSALHALSAYLGKDTLDINEITRSMLLGFKEWVDAQPKFTYRFGKGVTLPSESKAKLPGGGQSSRDLMKLAHIYNKAKERYNDEDAGVFNIPRNPFLGLPLSFPPSRTGQKNLGAEVMQVIIDAPADDPDRLCLDVFLVSFALMGANLVDLYAARPQREVWTYHRKKTAARRADGAEMRVDIPPQLSAALGRLEHGDEWWLGRLHKACPVAANATSFVNRGLARWAQRNGLPRFTFYAARKSWASIARKAGVEKATIDECLIHVGDLKMADIYIEKDYSLINEANRAVLSLFRWPCTDTTMTE